MYNFSQPSTSSYPRRHPFFNRVPTLVSIHAVASAARAASFKRACGKRRTAFPRLNQVKSLSPHHLFVIALHSPVKVTETGLRMCRPEKGRRIDAIRSRAVRFLQSALRTKHYEIRASLRISRQKARQFLCGLDLLAERAVSR